MKKRFVVGLCAVMLCVMSVSGTALAGNTTVGCSDWKTVKIGDAFCDSSDRCGLLWLKETNKVRVYAERVCLRSDATAYREGRIMQTKLGCCQ